MSTTDDKRKERILSLAMGEAIKYSVGGIVLTGLGTIFSAYRYKNFQKLTSISIKIAIPTMTGLGLFSVVYELKMNDMLRRPEKYGLTDDVIIKGKVTTMPVHHQLLNYVYDHPFQLVAGLGAPLATSILYSQRHNTHLTLSQKIMHSRVFAQAGVLTILLFTMGFREYMDRRGRFPEPEVSPST
jgi:hypothetical protein